MARVENNVGHLRSTKTSNMRATTFFFDYVSVPGGDFESVILENIFARAHFLILLTPSASEGCGEAGDWLAMTRR
jgi:hypothetical protein